MISIHIPNQTSDSCYSGVPSKVGARVTDGIASVAAYHVRFYGRRECDIFSGCYVTSI